MLPRPNEIRPPTPDLKNLTPPTASKHGGRQRQYHRLYAAPDANMTTANPSAIDTFMRAATIFCASPKMARNLPLILKIKNRFFPCFY
jgi:hypothetical protein